jgi:O-antigen/teichoic acid export membrane protein
MPAEKKETIVMIKKIQQYIHQGLRAVYIWFYKEEPSERVHVFIDRLSILSLAVAISGVLLAVLKIILIRKLGPTEYGIFALVNSLAYFYYIPILLGFHMATTQYLARTQQDARSIIGTAVTSVLGFLTVTAILTVLFQNILSKILNVSPEIILLGLVLTSAFSLMIMLRSILQSLERFYLTAVVEVGTTLTTGTLLFLFFLGHHYTHSYAVAAYTISFSIWILLAGIIFRTYIGTFSRTIFKSLFHYGFYAIIASIAGFLLITTENLILFRYYGATTVGYYSAYYSAAHALITNKILFVILSVLFPMLSYLRSETESALRKLDKLYLPLLGSLTVLNTGVIACIMYLFGKQYSFSLWLGILFALATSINFITQLYATFLNAEGIRGVRIYTYGMLFLATLSFISNLIFIRWYGIYAIVIISCIINATILFYFRWNLKRLRYGSTT